MQKILKTRFTTDESILADVKRGGRFVQFQYTKKLLTTKKKLIKHTKSLNGSKWQSIHSIRQKYNPESVNNCFTRLFAGLDLLPRCYFIIYEKNSENPNKKSSQI